MGYNLTQEERNKEAKSDLVKKLILEKKLISDLAPYYNKIKKSAKLLYATTNTVLDVSIFKSDLKDILAKHYRRVSKQFGDLGARQLESLLNSKSSSTAYSRLLDEYIREHSQLQANIISQTDQDKLNNAFKTALVLWFLLGRSALTSDVSVAPRSGVPQTSTSGSIPQAGEGISSEDLQIVQSQDILKNVSESGIELFNSKLDSRKEVISLTETQNIAETSKDIAVKTYLNESGTEGFKQWFSILDDRTRPWHVEAYGQIQRIDSPYLVGGQELMYPGDTTLGATPDNIINCRCSSHYFWKT